MKLTAKMKVYLEAEKNLRHATAMKREWEKAQYHARKLRDETLADAFGGLKGYGALKAK